MAAVLRDYFRGDQKAAITAPDLTKACTFADHIVSARGKKTQFTSVSLDRGRIERFGEVDYLLIRQKVDNDGHMLVEHEALVDALGTAAHNDEKAERLKAIQALRYARARKEGLVEWKFNVSGVTRKEMITWAFREVQKYFRRF